MIDKNPLMEAVRLYNKFNTMYTMNRSDYIRIVRQIACHSAQVHVDLVRHPKMSSKELTFWGDVYNELENIKRSI
jgi:hypothetical protein